MMAIRKLLIANRGEIAVRVIAAARALGIRTVAVYSDADVDARFVGDADEAVRLPGVLPADTYLDGNAIIAAADRAGADAVHPGYGFLSENAGFAAACATAGLVFVGPPAAAIEQMGDKLRAKELMASAGVPVLPGTTVADGSLADVEQALEAIGYPAIVKASAGGGGRGMRVVTGRGELAAALDSARREAGAAFGDDTVFVERYVAPARHIEVQVIADGTGQVATLVRAGVLDPAPPPEDRRGSAVAGRRCRRRAPSWAPPPRPQRAPWATRASAPSSSWPPPTARSPSWR